MQYTDIHTHHRPLHPARTIWNCSFSDLPALPSDFHCSLGLHPWYLSVDTLNEQLHQLKQSLTAYPQIVAVGEAGLDKLCQTPWTLQTEAFRAQIELAEQMGYPLIIHSVKAHNEVMELKKALKSDIPWVIHGFRGKKELAEQYLKAGFYLSYGFHYNEEALKATPLSRLFLETDESQTPVSQLYQQVAPLLQLSIEELARIIAQSADKVFFTR